MIIQSNLKYKNQLIELWQNVFGDEKGYVEILFDTIFNRCKCFVSMVDDVVVSALYLLPNELLFENENYSGLYLYAAATLENHRGKGLMSSLIHEAQKFAVANNYDYISLVPANEKLYDYYEKFSFTTAMYKIESTDTSRKSSDLVDFNQILTTNEVYEIRNSLKKNHFSWAKPELDYALKCLEFYGTKAYGDSEKYILYSSESCFIRELMFKSSEKELYLQDIKINSPYQLNSYQNKAKKFGMIYPINKKLKRNWSYKDIYMNLALD